jgi:adenylate cyclase
MPVAVLTAAAALGTVTVDAVLYLGVTFIALGTLQGIAISRSISKPLQNVVGEMARLRDGDLSAKAKVLSVDNVGHLSEGFNEMVEGLRRAELIRESFGRYVSREVLEKVLRGDVDLRGELRVATVLFCDIRGFTAISERMAPVHLLVQLNSYLDMMVDAVASFGGRVDKFIGDAVMAVFGIPLAQEDHALRAVKAGLEMLHRLEKWNAELETSKYSPWRIGVGIHSGEVVAGNIGSSKKMEYAVIGDVVNTASRIEQLDKEYNAGLIVSEATYNLVSSQVEGKRLGEVVLKGKKEPVTVFQIIGLK